MSEQTYTGGCQCGKVRYQVEVDLEKPVISCNCSMCGIKSFARGTGRDGGATVAINARCLDDVDVASLKIQSFDGRSR